MRSLRLIALLCLAVVITAAPAFADLIRVHDHPSASPRYPY